LREAEFYKKRKDRIICELCPHKCSLRDNEIGICGVRVRKGDKLFTLVYNRAASIAVDPIEKKPLFHFHPSKNILSIATPGCNMFCRFCQNYTLSFFEGKGKTERIFGEEYSLEELVLIAKKHNSIGIAYTYNEPTVFYEYLKDISVKMKENGLKNVWVTNGYIEEEPQLAMNDLIDAVNNDLKFFSDKKYKKYTGASLEPVLKTLKRWKKMGVWLEITTLIIPGVNDDEKEIDDIIGFIKDEIGVETPWHISKFHPSYKMSDYPPTPDKTIKRIRERGLEQGLRFVYSGNLWGDEGENTYCPVCGKLLIKRTGYNITEYNMQNGKCSFCGEKIEGEGL
jgi:pyruvate formate lyase activating enzyme